MRVVTYKSLKFSIRIIESFLISYSFERHVGKTLHLYKLRTWPNLLVYHRKRNLYYLQGSALKVPSSCECFWIVGSQESQNLTWCLQRTVTEFIWFQQLLNTEVMSEILCTFPKCCVVRRVAVVNNNEDMVTTFPNAKRETYA